MTNDYGNLELHKVLLEAMKDFDQLCRDNNLHYVLHGGSCLGAIRHKGFIPWDDDVDIAMLREDYEALINLIEKGKSMSEKYTVLTYKNDPQMLTNVMKIQINNSGFSGTSGADGQGEAFLDVFPMTTVPATTRFQQLQNKITIFLNECVYAKIGYISLTSWKSKITLGLLSKFSRRFLGNLIEFFIKHFPHSKKSEYVNIVATANYNNNTGYAWDLLPRKYFTELEEVEFEGVPLYITKYWDEYLSTHYGDYMTPPPEEKRQNKHNMTKINDEKD